MAEDRPLLQIVHALYPQSQGDVELYAWELARALGGAVLSLSPLPPQAEAPPAWQGLRVFTPQAGEGALSAWHRTLDAVQPQAVFVQHLGALSPALLLDLRERSIPYAIFLHDFTPLCPTHHLWHRREERCSGPGRTGWKCAWCVSGTWQRAAELPLRTLLYRHRPQDWRTALLRADALVASSRFARDFWVSQGAPPERIAVIPARLGLTQLPEPAPPATPVAGAPPRLLFAGGASQAEGAELLGAALDLIPSPLELHLTGDLDSTAQSWLRERFAGRHRLLFHGPVLPDALPALLASCGVVAIPPRWDLSFSRLALDAQAAGARVVATAIGGLAEFIIHGVNGFLAAPDDPPALAEALQEALGGGEPAWAGPLVAQYPSAAAAAATQTLCDLFDLLAHGAPEPDPSLELEHGPWLTRQAAALGSTRTEAAQLLVAALRGSDAAEPVFQQRAWQTTRRRRMELNHAVAFFRACGCRRIASAGPIPLAPNAVEWFATWGLACVDAHQLPDGLWFEGEEADPDLLRRRFPQALALVMALPDGVETVSWLDDLAQK